VASADDVVDDKSGVAVAGADFLLAQQLPAGLGGVVLVAGGELLLSLLVVMDKESCCWSGLLLGILMWSCADANVSLFVTILTGKDLLLLLLVSLCWLPLPVTLTAGTGASSWLLSLPVRVVV
jgi:hypothetical protein